jgi:hypothetical protein
MSDSPMWKQFRRLLLGTVIEYLLEAQVKVVFETISITFHRESEFRVPRLNNYMRFKGDLSAQLAAPVSPAEIRTLQDRVRQGWPELLKVVDIPIGDRLTPEKNHVKATVRDGAAGVKELHLEFDLEAD